MKKIKFIIITGVLFFIMEVGMWKSSQWLHANKESDTVNVIEFVMETIEDWNTRKMAKELRQVLTDELEEKEDVEDDSTLDEMEELLEAFKKNPEMKEFVEDYPKRDNWTNKEIKITEKEIKSGAPLFLQWDRRWGYSRYGSKMIAVNGCGPTCLSMVYVGLRGDGEMNPQKVALFSENCGYLTETAGTDWGLMTEGAQALGLNAEEVALDEGVILNTIRNGGQIICSMRPGDFTTTGHFIVIYGEKDGKLLIHDPNSIEKSEKEWEFEKIKGQIKNLWKYS